MYGVSANFRVFQFFIKTLTLICLIFNFHFMFVNFKILVLKRNLSLHKRKFNVQKENVSVNASLFWPLKRKILFLSVLYVCLCVFVLNKRLNQSGANFFGTSWPQGKFKDVKFRKILKNCFSNPRTFLVLVLYCTKRRYSQIEPWIKSKGP